MAKLVAKIVYEKNSSWINIINLNLLNLYLQQMSLCSKKSPLTPQKLSPSKVLLVCVYDTLVIEITNDMVYQKFKNYGNIIKLLIFQKGQVTKFFIEYSTIDQAAKAKKQLEGTKILQAICKMNIYFSNFGHVDLKNETSQGSDYSSDQQTREYFVKQFDILTKSSPQQDADQLNDLIMQSFDSFNPFARSKTDNPIKLSHQIAQISQYKQQNKIEQYQFDFQIKSSIESLLKSNSSSSTDQIQLYQNQSNTASKPSNQVRLKENVKTNNTILCFDFVDHIQIRHVYNLFSNFGNIAGISKKKKTIYIKFRSVQFAATSLMYLNSYFFMGTVLKLVYAQNEDKFTPKQNEFCELVYFDSSFDRFTAHKSITINSPSKTLHISSLKKEICRQKNLRSIFSEFGEVEAVHILKHTADKNMALVKFYEFEDSFRAIAQLHNSTFSGRKMQISFTKSRI